MVNVFAGTGAPPRLIAPPGSCDCHSHIFGPAATYPFVGEHAAVPPPEASVAEYRKPLARLGIDRSVIVHTIVHGMDNRRTTDAIAELGLNRARGVAICPPDIGAAEIRALTDAGIRGFRVSMLGGDAAFAALPDIARRIAPFGWHLQVQRQGKDALSWLPGLEGLAVPVVIDHMARMPPEVGLDDPRFTALLRLLATGQIWLKLSGPYYGSDDDPPYENLIPRIRRFVEVRPDRLVWALNWPHPSQPLDGKPDDAACLDLLLDAIAGADVRRAVLVDNPARLYGFPPIGRDGSSGQ